MPAGIDEECTDLEGTLIGFSKKKKFSYLYC
jgi:hypothetical protein